jgi:Protein of unknown function (DUF2721)
MSASIATLAATDSSLSLPSEGRVAIEIERAELRGACMSTNFLPEAEQLSHILSLATAPAFLLGAVAAFVAVLMNRLSGVVERILGAGKDAVSPRLDTDVSHLKRRAALLHQSISLALGAGICTALLLALGFVAAFFKVRHEYGAGVLFTTAVALLGGALFRFLQEIRLGLRELEHY